MSGKLESFNTNLTYVHASMMLGAVFNFFAVRMMMMMTMMMMTTTTIEVLYTLFLH